MIRLNGKNRSGFDGMTVAELLDALGYKTAYIAVELNGDIVKKDNYSSTRLSDGDSVEVVNFVGGG